MLEFFGLMGTCVAFIGFYLGALGLRTCGLSKKLRGLFVRQPKNAAWYSVSQFLSKERNEDTIRLIFFHLLLLRCVQVFFTLLLLSLFITGRLCILREVYTKIDIADLIGESNGESTVPIELGALALEFVGFLILAIWVRVHSSFITSRHDELAALPPDKYKAS